MRFLIVGDIVGKSGMLRLKKELPEIMSNENIDICIVNGENSANGKGLRIEEYNELISMGANVITMGNHIYYRKEMAEQYAKLPNLLIPANVTNLLGNGHTSISKENFKIGVINIIGKVGMGELFEKNTEDPFKIARQEVDILKQENVDYIFIDFHAEATAEKIAMGYYLSGEVTCVFGTHTHVQTADDIILPEGTAYITDVGMTGPKDSVIGLRREVALKRFVKGAYAKYECSTNEAIFNAVIVDTDDTTKKAISIKRIYKL